eukprot:5610111-Pleurochrysis_carterae.AAC.1
MHRNDAIASGREVSQDGIQGRCDVQAGAGLLALKDSGNTENVRKPQVASQNTAVRDIGHENMTGAGIA